MSVHLLLSEPKSRGVVLRPDWSSAPGTDPLRSALAEPPDGDTPAADRAVQTPPSRRPPPAEASGTADDSFIRSIYNQYAGPLLGVAMKLTGGDRHWAEDVVQETLLRAWRHADTLLANDESRSLMPWLATVARRIVINDWRGRGARTKEIDDAALTVPSVSDDTEQALHRLIVMGALARLTPAHRRVIVERYLHGRSIAEIAQMIGVPPGTVKSRMHYALRVMRAALSGRGVGP